MRAVIRHLRAAALLHKGGGPTDGQLLESFVARREEAAFEALLRRHGPMVLGVCRRVLRNAHDAEDAFQATFLVLVRKAGSVMPRDMVGNWLYGVAYRTAMKARAMNAKRHLKEKQARPAPQAEREAAEELLERLDHELSRLPDKYRVPVVLCELEGRSRKEVARLLGVPEGTLSWRLAQAKKLLARKLSRYGTVAVGALLAEGAVSACLSPVLRESTAKAALTAGAVPAKVLALTEGVLKAMLLSKLKITTCAAALMLLASVGATGLTYRATAQQPKQGGALASRPQADDLEALRLEIEALRKSLQATRERVKTLEGEVSALKGQSGGPQGMAPGGGAMPPGMKGSNMPGGGQGGPPGGGMPGGGSKPPSGGPQLPAPGGKGHQGVPGGGPPSGQLGRPGGGGVQPPGGMPPGMKGGLKTPEATADPVSDAEAALKKLRKKPGDKQATEALERALKRLKERKKPEPPAEGNGEGRNIQ
jgi:RNA polymerase sigma factor (sigma-70 family)